MDMKKNALAPLALAVCLGLGVLRPLGAQEKPAPDPWTFDFILRLLGADIGLGYRGVSLLPDAQTTFWLYGGGGYERKHYYRDSTGNFLSPGEIGSNGSLPNADPSFNRVEGAWRLGVEQGFAWNQRTFTNLIEAFLFYRGRYDQNLTANGALLTSPPLSVLPDRDSSFLNTLQLGVGYDDMLKDMHHVRNGTSAELSTEWGPPDGFVRFNGTFTWFVPLYDAAPDAHRNLLSVYFGEYFSVDYAAGLNGNRVPLSVRQTFGGRNQDTGLGDQVRGVDKGGYDANLKGVNNLEVRMNLLSIPMPDFVAGIVPEVIPGILAYFDCGFYDQVGEPGISSPASGLVAATGAGVYVEVPRFGSVLAYVEYRLDSPNAAGDRLRLFVLEFGMQF